MQLFPHQTEALNQTEQFNRVAYYLDMGLGKTFVGSEKMWELNSRVNLVICQKSKIDDWMQHFREHYADDYTALDLTNGKQFQQFVDMSADASSCPVVGVINYDLVFRRSYMAQITGFTLLLDESSIIQNETAKRSKFVLKMKPENVILLSGTPTSGKYENLWSQCQLLGWHITKDRFYNHYIIQEWIEDHESGFRIPHVVGYKNVDRLKRKLAEHGAIFMKTEDVIDLPEQQEIMVTVSSTKEYRKFMKDRVIWMDGVQLVGDTTLTKRMYARQLCGQYCREKLDAFKDLLESTADRLIVFYNFNAERDALKAICEALHRDVSYINGEGESLETYDSIPDSVTLVQYQAGAMGKNLQKANKIIYFTLPERSELFEQSKKRIHRIGQKNTCFYYYLLCKGSVEQDVLNTLKMRKDYTDALFQNYTNTAQ